MAKGCAHSNRSDHPDDNKNETRGVSRANRSLVAKEIHHVNRRRVGCEGKELQKIWRGGKEGE